MFSTSYPQAMRVVHRNSVSYPQSDLTPGPFPNPHPTRPSPREGEIGAPRSPPPSLGRGGGRDGLGKGAGGLGHAVKPGRCEFN